ncbi:MAG: prephenate dehydrogenase [Clostridia bacterium]|nr:prephenate dehydrogenase [Clostridia bacterium]
MKLEKNMKTLIVGLGLLGGSYAMSLKRQGYPVYAITRSQSSIDYALEHNMIDGGSTAVDPELIASADLVVFALYPNVFKNWIKENQQYFKPGAVITDVTGVKSCIVYEIQDMLRRDVEFIAAHPMAGKEVYGVENADDSIFHKANYIVVPTSKNTAAAMELCRDLGWKLGFKDVSELSPEMHDEMIAYLSQLTHCIAVSLMCCNDFRGLENYTGDSFRDLTRIAKINDDMWSELFLLNKDVLLREMDKFRRSFNDMYDKLESADRDGLREMMRVSTERRRRFDKKEI